MPVTLTEPPPRGTWVQTERAAHEAWVGLMQESPVAAMLMHILVSRMGEHNAVVASQRTLAYLLGKHVNTAKTALKVLRDRNWIEIRQIGDRGTVNAYIINDRVAWSGRRDGIRYSLFTARVLITDDEQPDHAELGEQASLQQLPDMGHGRGELPAYE